MDKQKIAYERKDNGIVLTNAKTDDIGKLAFEAKVPVLELSIKSASLEEAFLEVTAGAEEYTGRGVKNAK